MHSASFDKLYINSGRAILQISRYEAITLIRILTNHFSLRGWKIRMALRKLAAQQSLTFPDVDAEDNTNPTKWGTAACRLCGLFAETFFHLIFHHMRGASLINPITGKGPLPYSCTPRHRAVAHCLGLPDAPRKLIRFIHDNDIRPITWFGQAFCMSE